MFEQIMDRIGAANLLAFLGIGGVEAFNLVEFAQNWTIVMVAVSGTGAAIYSILKLIDWFEKRKLKK